MPGAEFAEPFEETGRGRDAAHIPGDGFHNDAGDPARMRGEGLFHRGQIVVGHGDGGFGEARAGTPAESEIPRVASPEPAFTSRESTWP